MNENNLWIVGWIALVGAVILVIFLAAQPVLAGIQQVVGVLAG